MTDKHINIFLNDLFPLNRSLTGRDNVKTIQYLIKKILPKGEIKSISSGKKIFDWIVPPEWNANEAYVKNKFGEKVIDFKKNNLHLVSYSTAFNGTISKKELLEHIHTLPEKPNSIPYRTSYYNKDWGFCCRENLIRSDKFQGPFEVNIDTSFNENGKLFWMEYVKSGSSDKEILISSYLCHPSLANDNLSGIILSCLLMKELTKIDTFYTYRLIIVPETIGSISFLSQANTKKIIGGMIVTCVGGNDKLSLKEGFNSSHWINEAAHLSLKSTTKDDYLTYPFVPDGSDERQYSSPEFRIVTPSIHKSKYYEYEEYHTSDDNLSFISSKNILFTLKAYIKWIENIESYCFPKRIMKSCEFQLGKRNLYPKVGGSINQKAHSENRDGFGLRKFDELNITGKHLEAFNWLMHLSDGNHSNFEISKISKIEIEIINESIEIFKTKKLIKVKN
ncbi:MAG: DUF4910 domain-containing protein [Flavobacteriaceae bacterium]